MDNHPTLTVRVRYLPHLISCLPGWAFLLLFAGLVTQLYYHDAAITCRAILSITCVLGIHAILGWLQKPTLHFLGAKLYVRRRWGDEQELINLRATDFILTQTAADQWRNTGSLQLKDRRLPGFAAKGGVETLRGVEDFDQVCTYVQAHFLT
ncbi:MAG: hypothetical protein IJE07_07195 [Clostridia bacterium]|nr:hypothetical protein [Clostridia bacterium]